MAEISSSSQAQFGQHQTRLSRKIFLGYLLSLIGLVAGYLGLAMLFVTVYATLRLEGIYPINMMYEFLSYHRVDVSIVVLLSGWLILTYRCIYRALSDLDALVTASAQLVQQPEQAVELPDDLKTVQTELNLVREQTLRSAVLAREAEQRKNDLLVYLAHDLKTPLTSVLGYLTLLRDEPQIYTELRARYTNIALNKAERLEELVNEFFEIARFNLTTVTLERQPIHLSRMLEQLTYEFLPILAEKQLRWDLQLTAELTIVGDVAKLERVFDNLIRNAVHYSYADSAIFLSLQERDKGVQLQITNQGRTIPPEKLARIFEQFFRLDAARSSSTGGAGLGLAIAKELVELHGGTISAQSSDDTVTFTLWLPAGGAVAGA